MSDLNNQTDTWRKAKVTRDASASVKILKTLENKGLIEICDVMLEGGRENRKVKNKILPVGVWDHSRWNECFWASDEDNTYDELREILGKNKIGDAMYLEAHIRNEHDYFVTEDRDFLNKREILSERFGVSILTPNELQELCNK